MVRAAGCTRRGRVPAPRVYRVVRRYGQRSGPLGRSGHGPGALALPPPPRPRPTSRANTGPSMLPRVPRSGTMVLAEGPRGVRTMTLRRKIVALTLCLLLLFAMTAAASLLLQNRISEHFSAVVDDYLPLDAAVATIDVFTDRYELDLRRLAADLRGPGANAAAIAQQGEAERLPRGRSADDDLPEDGSAARSDCARPQGECRTAFGDGRYPRPLRLHETRPAELYRGRPPNVRGARRRPRRRGCAYCRGFCSLSRLVRRRT